MRIASIAAAASSIGMLMAHCAGAADSDALEQVAAELAPLRRIEGRRSHTVACKRLSASLARV